MKENPSVYHVFIFLQNNFNYEQTPNINPNIRVYEKSTGIQLTSEKPPEGQSLFGRFYKRELQQEGAWFFEHFNLRLDVDIYETFMESTKAALSDNSKYYDLMKDYARVEEEKRRKEEEKKRKDEGRRAKLQKEKERKHRAKQDKEDESREAEEASKQEEAKDKRPEFDPTTLAPRSFGPFHIDLTKNLPVIDFKKMILRSVRKVWPKILETYELGFEFKVKDWDFVKMS